MKIIKQLTSDGRNGMKSLSYEIESRIYANVKENFPRNWDRGTITRALFSDLKKLLHNKTICTPGNNMISTWQLYQLKHESGTLFSDIAIIVQVSYHDGQVAKGVVFHDIAEKDAGKNTFSGLSKNKFRKPLSISPHSGLILFDYDAITGMAFPSTAESIIGTNPHNWNAWLPFTHAVVVPACLAVSLDVKTTGLYKVSLPLSYQLCYRYLFGLDLDFSTPALETAAGIRTDRGSPKFIVLINVVHGGAESAGAFEFDSSSYAKVE
jgi:hypothetical protein